MPRTRIHDAHIRQSHGVSGADWQYARRIIYQACCLAGSPTLMAESRRDLRRHSIGSKLSASSTAAIYDWLVLALSYQGISDQVAESFIAKHGSVTWRGLSREFSERRTHCPKLTSYWHFHQCGYRKSDATCLEPDWFESCRLPTHPLRNGHLSQMAYSLFLFIRDVCDGDLVGWIDRQLEAAHRGSIADRIDRMVASLLDPLRHVYGISDKTLMMSLSALLIGADGRRPLWLLTGVNMIAIDTLVHNFLHRTGILRRFHTDHTYGPACYMPGGCAAIIRSMAQTIDARAFNTTYPAYFPRFVQHAIWRYCAQAGLAVCNGNKVDDRNACQNLSCRLYGICDKIPMRPDTVENESVLAELTAG